MCRNRMFRLRGDGFFMPPTLIIAWKLHRFSTFYLLFFLYAGFLLIGTLLLISFCFSALLLMFMYYDFTVKTFTISNVCSSNRYFPLQRLSA